MIARPRDIFDEDVAPVKGPKPAWEAVGVFIIYTSPRGQGVIHDTGAGSVGFVQYKDGSRVSLTSSGVMRLKQEVESLLSNRPDVWDRLDDDLV